MGAFVAAVIGAVVAGVVSLVVSIIQSRERSARLLREVEALAKLETGTKAHSLMERHVELLIAEHGVDFQERLEGKTVDIVIHAIGGALLFLLWPWLALQWVVDITSWSTLYYIVLASLVVLTILVNILMHVSHRTYTRLKKQRQQSNG